MRLETGLIATSSISFVRIRAIREAIIDRRTVREAAPLARAHGRLTDACRHTGRACASFGGRGSGVTGVATVASIDKQPRFRARVGSCDRECENNRVYLMGPAYHSAGPGTGCGCCC